MPRHNRIYGKCEGYKRANYSREGKTLDEVKNTLAFCTLA